MLFWCIKKYCQNSGNVTVPNKNFLLLKILNETKFNNHFYDNIVVLSFYQVWCQYSYHCCIKIISLSRIYYKCLKISFHPDLYMEDKFSDILSP